jgi:hypothetical protein
VGGNDAVSSWGGGNSKTGPCVGGKDVGRRVTYIRGGCGVVASGDLRHPCSDMLSLNLLGMQAIPHT